MTHEDPEFVEAVAKVSQPSYVTEVRRMDEPIRFSSTIPHGVPTVSPQTAIRCAVDDMLDPSRLDTFLNRSPLHSYLRIWRGQAFLHGAGIFWTLVDHMVDKHLDVYVMDAYYNQFIGCLLSDATSKWFGVSAAKYARIGLGDHCIVNVRSLGDLSIKQAIAEEPVGVAAMYYNGDALFASDIGRLALSYGVNVITDNQKLCPDSELKLMQNFTRGIPVVLPRIDAQKFIDADGKLATVWFTALDTSQGCACGLCAQGIAFLRHGQAFYSRPIGNDIVYYNVWAHAVGCRLYTTERGRVLPTLDLNKMMHWALFWPHDKKFYVSDVGDEITAEAVTRKYEQMIHSNHYINRLTTWHWSACPALE